MQVRIHLGPMTNLSILFTFAGSNTASGLKSMADFNLGWFIRLLYLFLFVCIHACMYSSTGLVNQIILDALADWGVQAGRNQIN